MSHAAQKPKSTKKQRPHFRRAVLRGLGVVMPPLLTIVLFIWAWTTIDGYVLKPIENLVAWTAVSINADVRSEIPADTKPDMVTVVDNRGARVAPERIEQFSGHAGQIARSASLRGWQVVSFTYDGTKYVPITGRKWIPKSVYDTVKENPGDLTIETASSRDIYNRFVHIRYLKRWITIPTFLVVFVTLMYLFGKFIAAGMGRMFWNGVEALIHRLPVIRNVYSSVKQVTDFVFSEREIEYTRVVAVQYPRKGAWSVGFVTGESMLDIRSAANEAVVSVLMPTSPMPATGFTITVRKSETIDLDITIDQAIQFVVSCGVVVPPQQQQDEISGKISAAIAERLHADSPETGAVTSSSGNVNAQPSNNGDGQTGDDVRQAASDRDVAEADDGS
jgi:uncharacterized membrane protein